MGNLDVAVQQLQSLPPEQQQQVVDFIAFLRSKNQPSSFSQAELPDAAEQSALEAAGDLVGCLNGPADLSTNQAYMQGFGES